MSKVTIHVYDQGDLLNEQLLEQWETSQATLVLSGQFLMQRFLRQQSHTLWDDKRLLTLSGLWNTLGSELSQYLPQTDVIEPAYAETLVKAQLHDLPALAALQHYPSGISELIYHLEWIEKQADVDYQPTNELEEALQTLRQRLLEQGIILPAAKNSLIARHAKHIKLQRPLLFPPLPEFTRQLGGLLKGLARQGSVDVFLLSNSAVTEKALQMAGLENEHLLSHQNNEHPASTLFTNNKVSHPLRGQWMISNQQEIAALQLIKEWMQTIEPARIALVYPSVPHDIYPLLEAAAESEVPLLVREQVSAHNSLIATLLVKIATAWQLDEMDEAREEWLWDGRHFAISDQDWARLCQCDNADQLLRELLQLGWEMTDRAEHGYQMERTHAWLGELERRLGDGSHSVDALPQQFLQQTITQAASYGQGDAVMVLFSYAELAAVNVDAAVLCGVDQYQLDRVRSPFTSPQLLNKLPALAAPDRRPQFVAALSNVNQKVALIASEEAAAIWAESKRAVDSEGESVQQQTARQKARAAASRQQLINQQIQQAKEQIDRQRLPEKLGGQRRRAYSVTELEQYLSCPYGWFVSRILRPQQLSNRQARKGEIAHNVLANLFTIDPSERIEAIPQEILQNSVSELSDRERMILAHQLEAVLNSYDGPSWPFTPYKFEQSLTAEMEDEEGMFTFLGRVDRIDTLGEQGALVIDYKSNKPPTLNKKVLQPYLYPLMLNHTLGLQPLGFLYISLRFASHTGILAQRIDGLEGQLRYDWSFRAQEALQEAKKAISGIESGQWSRIGNNCPAYCQHHLISETGVINV